MTTRSPPTSTYCASASCTPSNPARVDSITENGPEQLPRPKPPIPLSVFLAGVVSGNGAAERVSG